MIFNCGLTNEEWERVHRQWHSFFPLFPRTIEVVNGKHVCAWLETIERRAVDVRYWDGRWVDWEYRRISAAEEPKEK